MELTFHPSCYSIWEKEYRHQDLLSIKSEKSATSTLLENKQAPPEIPVSNLIRCQKCEQDVRPDRWEQHQRERHKRPILQEPVNTFSPGKVAESTARRKLKLPEKPVGKGVILLNKEQAERRKEERRKYLERLSKELRNDIKILGKKAKSTSYIDAMYFRLPGCFECGKRR